MRSSSRWVATASRPEVKGWLPIGDPVEEVVYGCGEAEGFGRGRPAEGLRAEIACRGDYRRR